MSLGSTTMPPRWSEFVACREGERSNPTTITGMEFYEPAKPPQPEKNPDPMKKVSASSSLRTFY